MTLNQISDKLAGIIESAKVCEDAHGLYDLILEDVVEVKEEIDKLAKLWGCVNPVNDRQ